MAKHELHFKCNRELQDLFYCREREPFKKIVAGLEAAGPRPLPRPLPQLTPVIELHNGSKLFFTEEPLKAAEKEVWRSFETDNIIHELDIVGLRNATDDEIGFGSSTPLTVAPTAAPAIVRHSTPLPQSTLTDSADDRRKTGWFGK